jgi:anthranilate phosphoribosyltransferase
VIIEAIQKLVERQDLSEAEARSAMEDLMSGQATDAQIAAFLTALRMKGETPQELVAFASVMRERAEPFWDGHSIAVLDTCGTGGDRSGTFNISTAAAFVAAGAGARVAKHGNRSATSLCGSADVLEALGVDIQMPLDRLRTAVTEVGFGFLFAQRFHRSMKFVMPARTQLKVRTVFNIIGPLANPASPAFQIVGVASPESMDLVGRALLGLQAARAFVVHSHDGLDEISLSGPTRVLEVRDGDVHRSQISPEDFGIARAPNEALRGGDAPTNARIVEEILSGVEKGPKRDVVVLNAAAGLTAAGVAPSIPEGIAVATASIDSGAAAKKLKALRELSR